MAADPTTVHLTNGTYSLDIVSYKIERDSDKQLIMLSVPKSTDPQNKSPITDKPNPLNYNIDLQQLKQVLTITGYLLEETGSSSLTKQDQLEAMKSVSKSITLTWKIGTTTITKYGNIIKDKISEIPVLIGDEHPSTQRKSFPIILQFAVGQHRG